MGWVGCWELQGCSRAGLAEVLCVLLFLDGFAHCGKSW